MSGLNENHEARLRTTFAYGDQQLAEALNPLRRAFTAKADLLRAQPEGATEVASELTANLAIQDDLEKLQRRGERSPETLPSLVP